MTFLLYFEIYWYERYIIGSGKTKLGYVSDKVEIVSLCKSNFNFV